MARQKDEEFDLYGEDDAAPDGYSHQLSSNSADPATRQPTGSEELRDAAKSTLATAEQEGRLSVVLAQTQAARGGEELRDAAKSTLAAADQDGRLSVVLSSTLEARAGEQTTDVVEEETLPRHTRRRPRAATVDVAVRMHKSEWQGIDDSSDDEALPKFTKSHSDAFSNRERRITAAQNALSQQRMIGDIEVEIKKFGKEWDEGEGSEGESAQPAFHATRSFNAREQRLQLRSEALQAGKVLGDHDVELLTQSTEWSGVDESDEEKDNQAEKLDKHAMETFATREARLEVADKALKEEVPLGDVEVEVVAQTKEWAGMEDSEGEEPAASEENVSAAADEAFQRRERRLTVSAETLGKAVVLGDAEVEVVSENKEWAGVADSDEEGVPDGKEDAMFDRHASEVFAARERRLTVAMETQQQEEISGDVQVELMTENAEWSGIKDSDDEADSGTLPEKAASYAHAAREKRLSVAAEVLKNEIALGDTEVEVVQQTGEWTGIQDSDDEAEKDNKANLEETHTASFTAREKRLSLAHEALNQEVLIGDSDVHVMPENKEWAGMEDSDSDHDGSKLKDTHTASFHAREKRLTVSEEALKQSVPIGDADVEVVNQGKEWAADVADSDEDCGAENRIEKHASRSFETRERRLTQSGEMIKLDQPLGDAEVTVVTHNKEWSGAVNDSDDENSHEQRLVKSASRCSVARERRLSGTGVGLPMDRESSYMSDAAAAVKLNKEGGDWIAQQRNNLNNYESLETEQPQRAQPPMAPRCADRCQSNCVIC